jgi:hypothetical protein
MTRPSAIGLFGGAGMLKSGTRKYFLTWENDIVRRLNIIPTRMS